MCVFLYNIILLAETRRNTSKVGASRRKSKFLNLFNIVTFPNTFCSHPSGLSGTCYSPSDCRERGGTPGGVCASGFGVCCLFQQLCGKPMGENTTFLMTDVSASSCVYTICKRNPSITLLRLDFTQFDISPPFTCGASSESVACTTTDGPLIGDCIYDSFTVTSPGTRAPPVICGYNTGQHMYVRASEDCNNIIFNFALEKTFTRNWNIQVSQLDEFANQDTLPPSGCLQWHAGTGAGVVSNFNFKDSDSFHLSSQKYSICWRREMGKCSLCFSPGYFALSNVPSKVPSTSTTSWTTKAGFTDSICCSEDSPSANCGTSGANDFIEIDNSRASSASDNSVVGDGSRYCGRFLAVDSSSVTYSAGSTSTVCTAALPFRMRVNFSPGEVLSSTSSSVCSTSSKTGDTVDECSKFRKFGNKKGTLGFQLYWWQVDCS